MYYGVSRVEAPIPNQDPIRNLQGDIFSIRLGPISVFFFPLGG